MVNFINDRELAKRFAKDAVPEKEQMWYTLIFITLTSVFGSEYFYFLDIDTLADLEEVKSEINIVSDLFFAAVWSGTIYLAYRVNAKGDNKNFVGRYMSIGFPLMVRILLAVITFFIGMVIVGYIWGGKVFELLELLPAPVFPSIILLYYYRRLMVDFEIASGQNK